ncbi:MAG: mechanosensitive ion channel family protein [Gammaproteobacteria bacterium]|nr:mechanosensitive ion channel family protein [Gammaproteobacteria bacterium]
MGILYAIAVTAALVVLLALLRLLFKRLSARVEATLAQSDWVLKIQQLELLSAEGFTRGLVWSIHSIHALSALFLIYLYIPILLALFPGTEPLAQPFADYFSDPLAQMWAAMVNYAPSLLNILVIVFYTWLILKLLHGFFVAFRVRYITLPGFHAEWAEPTYKIIRFLVLALSLVMILPLLPGADSPAFTGISLFVGAMVTLGSTSAMGNITSGIVLIYTRSFNRGDFVQIGDSFGQVIERTLLATRLQTTKNENITIPNSAVLSSQVINYSDTSDSTELIVHTSIGLGYAVDWRKVHELLGNAANKTAHIEPDPEPFVLQKSLDDFSVSYEINAYTKRPDLLPGIYSELNRNILDEFGREKIEIMSPTYTSVRDGNRLAVPTTGK